MTHPSRRLARIPGRRWLSLAVLLGALAPFAIPAARAEPRRLDDSTRVDSWQLSNGLRVVTRDVPRSSGVSMTLAFGFGSEQDPKNREGWMSLLANVEFSSAAGEFPERTFADLESSRPLGWRVEVGRRYTRLTEVATTQQFPGVLHQTALRMRSLAPSGKVLAEARKAVKAQLAENYEGRVSYALYYDVRELAVTGSDSSARRYASGKGIEGGTIGDVRQALAKLYVPANAVLSLAGNLSGSGIDLRRALENEFGTIPPGEPATPPPALPLSAGLHSVVRPGLELAIGVVGLIAPALSDTAHPSFYLHTLLVGSGLAGRWGRSTMVPSPLQYSLLDDPEMVRIYPPVTSSDLSANKVREEYSEGLLAMSGSTIQREDFSLLHDSVLWMLGGSMGFALSGRAETDPGVLAALSTTAAMRELWGGEKFWAQYRSAFSKADRPEFSHWMQYFSAAENQVHLIFVPDWEEKK